MAKGMPLEIGVAIFGGECMNDIGAVVMNAATAVRLSKLSYERTIIHLSCHSSLYNE